MIGYERCVLERHNQHKQRWATASKTQQEGNRRRAKLPDILNDDIFKHSPALCRHTQRSLQMDGKVAGSNHCTHSTSVWLKVGCQKQMYSSDSWKNRARNIVKLEEGDFSQDLLGTDFLQRRLHPAFSCPDMSPSPTVPTSVEFVKAADVKVIAALGDSLTTAIGANGSTILAIPFEFRQVSWSIGGYGTFQNVITLANIFKLFNPKLMFPSPVMTLHGTATTVDKTGFNFAITGHNTLNVSDQIRTMIDTFKSYPGLNFQEDWKVVTMLIGMNDICDYCKNKEMFSPDSFIHYMTAALDMMMNEIPRTIVNVVQILPMKALREVQSPVLGCNLQRSFCSCLVQPEEGSPELEELVEINYEFQRRLKKLLDSDRFFKKDFAAVLQPYLEIAQPPRLPDGKIDVSFFTADCFHFTVKGHEELAKGLWNNMFQPEEGKEMIETFSEPINLICPTEEHPYIYTRPRVTGRSSAPLMKDFSMNTLMLMFLFSGFNYL